jgi:hypothetical protein
MRLKEEDGYVFIPWKENELERKMSPDQDEEGSVKHLNISNSCPIRVRKQRLTFLSAVSVQLLILSQQFTFVVMLL